VASWSRGERYVDATTESPAPTTGEPATARASR
jgi:hypothetical protein